MHTVRQRRGSHAEELAAQYVATLGWKVLARNVKVGARDEIDLVALDPGPPRELSASRFVRRASAAFGAPEERVDRRKVGNLYRAARAFSSVAASPRAGSRCPADVRVDLVVVDLRGGQPEIRHLRRLEPA